LPAVSGRFLFTGRFVPVRALARAFLVRDNTAKEEFIMEILAVDIGTGTQDILVFNTDLDPENSYKLVVPSPTMIFQRQVQRATRLRKPVLLTGVLMGGGPLTWAVEAHIAAGLAVYATPSAARTFDDDLEAVQREMGVTLVGEDEAQALRGDVMRLELADLDLDTIAAAFGHLGYSLAPDLIAVAVFDHGDAPVGYSDRQFRFDYLDERIRACGRLSAFAYRADEIPNTMTRLQAVAGAARRLGMPMMVMDTAPAAILGATLDVAVAERAQVLVANIGNFHTLVFRLGPTGIEGVFEHHTGEVTRDRLDDLVAALAAGTLTHQDVFDDRGHGAAVLASDPMQLRDDSWNLAVTGPRRSLIGDSRHRAYYAVPYGDMMMAGCFGMLRALGDVYPDYAQAVLDSLARPGGRPPWEIV
jgi:uncharacterized protein (DUF1786 family)